MEYVKTENRTVYGIAYEYDPACYMKYNYYQSQDERNLEFQRVLETGEIYDYITRAVHKPIRVFTFEADEHIYEQPRSRK